MMNNVKKSSGGIEQFKTSKASDYKEYKEKKKISEIKNGSIMTAIPLFKKDIIGKTSLLNVT